MSKKEFTADELALLKGNKYTYAATSHTLSFTKEFKEIFWNEYQAGGVPRKILEKYGYPVGILGKERIWGIAQVIKKQSGSPQGLHEGPLPRRDATAEGEGQSLEERVKKLQVEVEYLGREVEFLKKLYLNLK